MVQDNGDKFIPLNCGKMLFDKEKHLFVVKVPVIENINQQNQEHKTKQHQRMV